MNLQFNVRFNFSIVIFIFFLFVLSNYVIAQEIKLSEWKEPAGMHSTVLSLGLGETDRRGFGNYSPNERIFFDEVLPSFFKRTIVLDSLSGDRGIKWIFSGPREGFYIELHENRLYFCRYYYDSFGFNLNQEKLPRFPKLEYNKIEIVADKLIKAITVELNYKLKLIVSINGKDIINQTIIEDIRRNQIHLTGKEGSLSARLLTPETIDEKVKVNSNITYQQMLEWGGLGIPTAYRQLSEEGKTKWWQYISEYNLLCQREYPVGGLLNPNLNNWDNVSYAKAHYYGDNFPNGEISDFEYNRKIQELGGFVMFEFWDFPRWIGDNEKEYARAIVGYCREALKKAGSVPRIVGIQNEVDMPEDRIKRFVPELRKALDEAGFKYIKIHMGNASSLRNALLRVNKYTSNPEIWKCIDYSASNMYDYQLCFDNPDAFDSTLIAWNGKVNSRPFISTELCINDDRYQVDSYRIALAMGQLYNKNLTLANAVLICYCWSILNIEQVSFGATRSLFVVSPENGFVPVPSSNQLRVFGAYSRRIKEGMYRVETKNSMDDLKMVAFKGDNNLATIVILNRSLNPVNLEIEWKNISFSEMEIVDPYSPNIVKPFSGNSVKVEPGSIITITNVPLNKSRISN